MIVTKERVFAEIERLCGGNSDAISLICEAWTACEVWDDLVDGDKPTEPVDVNKTLIWAMFGLQENPIYRKHPELATVLRLTISNWLASNVLERSGEKEHRVTAYTLRCSPYDFFAAVVLCVSGSKMADEAVIFFRSIISSETIDDFLAEHT